MGYTGSTHNHSGKNPTPTYITWRAMLSRTRRKCDTYAHVWVCPAWLKFENFLDDMGVRPDNKTLDRIDNSKGYLKSNCRWSTKYEQNINRKSTIIVQWGGEEMPLMELSKEVSDKVYSLSLEFQ